MRLCFLLILGVALVLPVVNASPSEVWVEVHDASPGFGVGSLDQILEVLEGHEIDRTVIFVIPDHGGTTPLSEYPDFVDYLKAKETEGIEIGAHGYTHQGFEFACSGERARELIMESKGEFELAGLSPRVFAPPRYLVTRDALEVLLQEYDSVFLLIKVAYQDHDMPSLTYDFTFGLPHQLVLPVAKLTYILNPGGVYRLSIHVDHADNEESLRFLDEFLTWTDGRP